LEKDLSNLFARVKAARNKADHQIQMVHQSGPPDTIN